MYGELPRHVPGRGDQHCQYFLHQNGAGGAKNFELCSRTRDNSAVFLKLADSGNSQCVKPLDEQGDENDEDDDKLGEQIHKQSEDMLRMLKKK